MDAFNRDHYVPILFTKAGERDALGQIDDAKKRRFTPLFVAHPIDWDFDLDQPKKTVDDHLKKLPADLKKTWGKRAAFIDVLHLDEETMADGRHPLEWMVTEASKIQLELVPVVSPSRSAESLEAARTLLGSGTSADVCLRLEAEHWPVPPQSQEIDALLDHLGAKKSNTHLMIDLRDNTGSSSLFALNTALQSLSMPAEWKTVTATATAMPQTLPLGQGLHEIPRQEWLNYRQLVDNERYGARQPTFGDYAIAHPDPFAEVDPRYLQISGKLKYTCNSKWLFGRGTLFKGTQGRSEGGEAIRPAARAISAHNEFTATHCGSEPWITAAASDGPTGMPRTWVTVGTQHHLLRVLDQIESINSQGANVPGS
ncbi:beta family protein [Mycobacterium sp. 5-140-3-2]|uniref:beta family protein n=1 Tax=unclassified Mycobacterium TaxID=2642494 RepID=UPI002D79B606|nr:MULTISPECIES: beta family protein [unclassified Mycobacterium]WRU83597.1 beta family protein [Mycobacterium sp. 5-140-3-2]WSE40257.1 beta family protein [Mycobacterium sp. 5-140-3-1]